MNKFQKVYASIVKAGQKNNERNGLQHLNALTFRQQRIDYRQVFKGEPLINLVDFKEFVKNT